jgi:thiamine biosynthesis protein ThiI
LLKIGELTLKGLNRRTFEDQLLKDLKQKLKPLGNWQFVLSQSTLQVIPPDGEIDMNEAYARALRVFGLSGVSRALRCEKSMDVILEKAPIYLENDLACARTFKVEAKRSDKSFSLNSPQICESVGEKLLDAFAHLQVDVHHPDVTVMVEIREQFAFLHAGQARGAGGLPAGSAGDAAILISGGIDSPVAAWMMARRGLRLTAIHFASPPYTSQRAEDKVHKLLAKVARYAGRIELYVVPFTQTQEAIQAHCPEDLFTLIMRRVMMRLAQAIAKEHRCKALITGESLGQVASQTLQALVVTEDVCQIPVFRPLIGMDKNDAIEIARSIGTFDISIEPYQDCCTVFTPKHPRTKPKLAQLQIAESALDLDKLMADALAGTRKHVIES